MIITWHCPYCTARTSSARALGHHIAAAHATAPGAFPPATDVVFCTCGRMWIDADARARHVARGCGMPEPAAPVRARLEHGWHTSINTLFTKQRRTTVEA